MSLEDTVPVTCSDGADKRCHWKFWCCAFLPPRRGRNRKAQAGGTPLAGSALGSGSGYENSHALKGHNKSVDKSLVSPFQGRADSHLDRIPRADPASGVSPAWADMSLPLRGEIQKAQHLGSGSLVTRRWCEAGKTALVQRSKTWGGKSGRDSSRTARASPRKVWNSAI